MDERELGFEVYRTGRGTALSIDGDGELTLRVAVPAQDRDAALALVDMLRGDVRVRLVAVWS